MTAPNNAKLTEALEDCRTHRDAWLKALQIAHDRACVSPPDIDDKSYWRHEIAVFHRTFDALKL